MTKKSAYRHFTEEQVQKAEATSYVLQIGVDLFYEGERCAFSKKKTEKFYEYVLLGLKDLIKNGSEEEKQDAVRSCYNLRIIPLRIQ